MKRTRIRPTSATPAAILLWLLPQLVAAQEPDPAMVMAAKFQNPLAALQAVFTDNSIAFGTGNTEATSYGFQFQPVYALDSPKLGMTFIPRAVIPILGLEPGTNVPPAGGGTVPGERSAWGLGDMALQFMVAPHVASDWKWGLGPQFTLKTKTNSDLVGPGWGAGAVGILTNGNLLPNLSFTWIVSQIWSFDGSVSTATLQPSTFYNFPSVPGLFISYTGVFAADWKAESGNTWTVPLGLSIGRTFVLGGGNGLDMMIGPYFNVVRPDGAPKWAIRFGISWMFP